MITSKTIVHSSPGICDCSEWACVWHIAYTVYSNYSQQVDVSPAVVGACAFEVCGVSFRADDIHEQAGTLVLMSRRFLINKPDDNVQYRSQIAYD